MNTPSPQGPTIPQSTNFITNFTRLLKVTDITGDSFSTSNPATPQTNTVLSNGVLSNLNNPISNSQGATYSYAQSHGGGGNPGGPITAIQYNNAGSFGGSSSFTFNNVTNTLTATNISNGTLEIGSNTISGLSVPTSGTEAATKNYVDNYTSLTITNVNTTGSTTYTASSLINGLIYRNTQTSGTTTDLLPTAAQIVAASNAIVGTTIYFGIKNVSVDYTNVVNFTVGSGITFGNSQNIFSGYEYDGVMIVTDVSAGFEAITIYTLNCTLTNTVNWGIEIGGLANFLNILRITDYYMIFNKANTLDPSTTLQVSTTNVSGKISYCNNSSPLTVTLEPPETFMGVIRGTSTISIPFIWSSGGVDFYIINQSTTSGADVTLSGSSGSIPWTLDPNSNMTIPPGYTGWFMIYLTVTNYPELSSLTSANVYTLGIFTNT